MKKVNNIALDGELRKNCYYVIMSYMLPCLLSYYVLHITLSFMLF